MSYQWFLKAALDQMHDLMAGYVERGEVPGMVTLVSRHGELHVDVIGTMKMGSPDPLQRDTIFRITSMTKPITAAATMLLVDEGKLQLDEPVDRLLPELANRRVLKRLDGPLDDTVPAKRAITVRDLLTFRMGIGIVMAAPDSTPILRAMIEQQLGQGPSAPAATPEPDEWMRRLGMLPLMYQPGERWLYNTGADVLGVLIARASGKPLGAFLRDRLFEPLGMKDTAFSVPADKIGRFATSYGTDFKTGKFEVYDEAAGGQWSRPPAFPAGGAGLVSTADDYLVFSRMMANKGRHGSKPIISAASVELMTGDQLTPQQHASAGIILGENRGWGLGISVVTREDELFGHVGRYGWDGGFGTSWASDPREEMTGILMTQAAWTSPIPPPVYGDFWRTAYKAIKR
jgi:CubicO group peptidase (beta-lactamase class C family)